MTFLSNIFGLNNIFLNAVNPESNSRTLSFSAADLRKYFDYIEAVRRYRQLENVQNPSESQNRELERLQRNLDEKRTALENMLRAKNLPPNNHAVIENYIERQAGSNRALLNNFAGLAQLIVERQRYQPNSNNYRNVTEMMTVLIATINRQLEQLGLIDEQTGYTHILLCLFRNKLNVPIFEREQISAPLISSLLDKYNIRVPGVNPDVNIAMLEDPGRVLISGDALLHNSPTMYLKHIIYQLLNDNEVYSSADLRTNGVTINFMRALLAAAEDNKIFLSNSEKQALENSIDQNLSGANTSEEVRAIINRLTDTCRARAILSSNYNLNSNSNNSFNNLDLLSFLNSLVCPNGRLRETGPDGESRPNPVAHYRVTNLAALLQLISSSGNAELLNMPIDSAFTSTYGSRIVGRLPPNVRTFGQLVNYIRANYQSLVPADIPIDLSRVTLADSPEILAFKLLLYKNLSDNRERVSVERRLHMHMLSLLREPPDPEHPLSREIRNEILGIDINSTSVKVREIMLFAQNFNKVVTLNINNQPAQLLLVRQRLPQSPNILIYQFGQHIFLYQNGQLTPAKFNNGRLDPAGQPNPQTEAFFQASREQINEIVNNTERNLALLLSIVRGKRPGDSVQLTETTRTFIGEVLDGLYNPAVRQMRYQIFNSPEFNRQNVAIYSHALELDPTPSFIDSVYDHPGRAMERFLLTTTIFGLRNLFRKSDPDQNDYSRLMLRLLPVLTGGERSRLETLIDVIRNSQDLGRETDRHYMQLLQLLLTLIFVIRPAANNLFRVAMWRRLSNSDYEITLSSGEKIRLPRREFLSFQRALRFARQIEQAELNNESPSFIRHRFRENFGLIRTQNNEMAEIIENEIVRTVQERQQGNGPGLFRRLWWRTFGRTFSDFAMISERNRRRLADSSISPEERQVIVRNMRVWGYSKAIFNFIFGPLTAARRILHYDTLRTVGGQETSYSLPLFADSVLPDERYTPQDSNRIREMIRDQLDVIDYSNEAQREQTLREYNNLGANADIGEFLENHVPEEYRDLIAQLHNRSRVINTINERIVSAENTNSPVRIVRENNSLFVVTNDRRIPITNIEFGSETEPRIVITRPMGVQGAEPAITIILPHELSTMDEAHLNTAVTSAVTKIRTELNRVPQLVDPSTRTNVAEVFAEVRNRASAAEKRTLDAHQRHLKQNHLWEALNRVPRAAVEMFLERLMGDSASRDINSYRTILTESMFEERYGRNLSNREQAIRNLLREGYQVSFTREGLIIARGSERYTVISEPAMEQDPAYPNDPSKRRVKRNNQGEIINELYFYAGNNRAQRRAIGNGNLPANLDSVLRESLQTLNNNTAFIHQLTSEARESYLPQESVVFTQENLSLGLRRIARMFNRYISERYLGEADRVAQHESELIRMSNRSLLAEAQRLAREIRSHAAAHPNESGTNANMIRYTAIMREMLWRRTTGQIIIEEVEQPDGTKIERIRPDSAADETAINDSDSLSTRLRSRFSADVWAAHGQNIVSWFNQGWTFEDIVTHVNHLGRQGGDNFYTNADFNRLQRKNTTQAHLFNEIFIERNGNRYFRADLTRARLTEILATLNLTANERSQIESRWESVQNAPRSLRGIRLNRVQIAGAVATREGRILNLDCGEGKTWVLRLAGLTRVAEGRIALITTSSADLAIKAAREDAWFYQASGIEGDRLVTFASRNIENSREDAFGRPGERIQPRIVYMEADDFGFEMIGHREELFRGGRGTLPLDNMFFLYDEFDDFMVNNNPLLLSFGSNGSISQDQFDFTSETNRLARELQRTCLDRHIINWDGKGEQAYEIPEEKRTEYNNEINRLIQSELSREGSAIRRIYNEYSRRHPELAANEGYLFRQICRQEIANHLHVMMNFQEGRDYRVNEISSRGNRRFSVTHINSPKDTAQPGTTFTNEFERFGFSLGLQGALEFRAYSGRYGSGPVPLEQFNAGNADSVSLTRRRVLLLAMEYGLGGASGSIVEVDRALEMLGITYYDAGKARAPRVVRENRFFNNVENKMNAVEQLLLDRIIRPVAERVLNPTGVFIENVNAAEEFINRLGVHVLTESQPVNRTQRLTDFIQEYNDASGFDKIRLENTNNNQARLRLIGRISEETRDRLAEIIGQNAAQNLFEQSRNKTNILFISSRQQNSVQRLGAVTESSRENTITVFTNAAGRGTDFFVAYNRVLESLNVALSNGQPLEEFFNTALVDLTGQDGNSGKLGQLRRDVERLESQRNKIESRNRSRTTGVFSTILNQIGSFANRSEVENLTKQIEEKQLKIRELETTRDALRSLSTLNSNELHNLSNRTYDLVVTEYSRYGENVMAQIFKRIDRQSIGGRLDVFASMEDSLFREFFGDADDPRRALILETSERNGEYRNETIVQMLTRMAETTMRSITNDTINQAAGDPIMELAESERIQAENRLLALWNMRGDFESSMELIRTRLVDNIIEQAFAGGRLNRNLLRSLAAEQLFIPADRIQDSQLPTNMSADAAKNYLRRIAREFYVNTSGLLPSNLPDQEGIGRRIGEGLGLETLITGRVNIETRNRICENIIEQAFANRSFNRTLFTNLARNLLNINQESLNNISENMGRREARRLLRDLASNAEPVSLRSLYRNYENAIRSIHSGDVNAARQRALNDFMQGIDSIYRNVYRRVMSPNDVFNQSSDLFRIKNSVSIRRDFGDWRVSVTRNANNPGQRIVTLTPPAGSNLEPITESFTAETQDDVLRDLYARFERINAGELSNAANSRTTRAIDIPANIEAEIRRQAIQHLSRSRRFRDMNLAASEFGLGAVSYEQDGRMRVTMLVSVRNEQGRFLNTSLEYEVTFSGNNQENFQVVQRAPGGDVLTETSLARERISNIPGAILFQGLENLRNNNGIVMSPESVPIILRNGQRIEIPQSIVQKLTGDPESTTFIDGRNELINFLRGQNLNQNDIANFTRQTLESARLIYQRNHGQFEIREELHPSGMTYYNIKIDTESTEVRIPRNIYDKLRAPHNSAEYNSGVQELRTYLNNNYRQQIDAEQMDRYTQRISRIINYMGGSERIINANGAGITVRLPSGLTVPLLVSAERQQRMLEIAGRYVTQWGNNPNYSQMINSPEYQEWLGQIEQDLRTEIERLPYELTETDRQNLLQQARNNLNRDLISSHLMATNQVQMMQQLQRPVRAYMENAIREIQREAAALPEAQREAFINGRMQGVISRANEFSRAMTERMNECYSQALSESNIWRTGTLQNNPERLAEINQRARALFAERTGINANSVGELTIDHLQHEGPIVMRLNGAGIPWTNISTSGLHGLGTGLVTGLIMNSGRFFGAIMTGEAAQYNSADYRRIAADVLRTSIDFSSFNVQTAVAGSMIRNPGRAGILVMGVHSRLRNSGENLGFTTAFNEGINLAAFELLSRGTNGSLNLLSRSLAAGENPGLMSRMINNRTFRAQLPLAIAIVGSQFIMQAVGNTEIVRDLQSTVEKSTLSETLGAGSNVAFDVYALTQLRPGATQFAERVTQFFGRRGVQVGVNQMVRGAEVAVFERGSMSAARALAARIGGKLSTGWIPGVGQVILVVTTAVDVATLGIYGFYMFDDWNTGLGKREFAGWADMQALAYGSNVHMGNSALAEMQGIIPNLTKAGTDNRKHYLTFQALRLMYRRGLITDQDVLNTNYNLGAILGDSNGPNARTLGPWRNRLLQFLRVENENQAYEIYREIWPYDVIPVQNIQGAFVRELAQVGAQRLHAHRVKAGVYTESDFYSNEVGRAGFIVRDRLSFRDAYVDFIFANQPRAINSPQRENPQLSITNPAQIRAFLENMIPGGEMAQRYQRYCRYLVNINQRGARDPMYTREEVNRFFAFEETARRNGYPREYWNANIPPAQAGQGQERFTLLRFFPQNTPEAQQRFRQFIEFINTNPSYAAFRQNGRQLVTLPNLANRAENNTVFGADEALYLLGSMQDTEVARNTLNFSANLSLDNDVVLNSQDLNRYADVVRGIDSAAQNQSGGLNIGGTPIALNEATLRQMEQFITRMEQGDIEDYRLPSQTTSWLTITANQNMSREANAYHLYMRMKQIVTIARAQQRMNIPVTGFVAAGENLDTYCTPIGVISLNPDRNQQELITVEPTPTYTEADAFATAQSYVPFHRNAQVTNRGLEFVLTRANYLPGSPYRVSIRYNGNEVGAKFYRSGTNAQEREEQIIRDLEVIATQFHNSDSLARERLNGGGEGTDRTHTIVSDGNLIQLENGGIGFIDTTLLRFTEDDWSFYRLEQETLGRDPANLRTIQRYTADTGAAHMATQFAHNLKEQIRLNDPAQNQLSPQNFQSLFPNATIVSADFRTRRTDGQSVYEVNVRSGNGQPVRYLVADNKVYQYNNEMTTSFHNLLVRNSSGQYVLARNTLDPQIQALAGALFARGYSGSRPTDRDFADPTTILQVSYLNSGQLAVRLNNGKYYQVGQNNQLVEIEQAAFNGGQICYSRTANVLISDDAGIIRRLNQAMTNRRLSLSGPANILTQNGDIDPNAITNLQRNILQISCYYSIGRGGIYRAIRGFINGNWQYIKPAIDLAANTFFNYGTAPDGRPIVWTKDNDTESGPTGSASIMLPSIDSDGNISAMSDAKANYWRLKFRETFIRYLLEGRITINNGQVNFNGNEFLVQITEGGLNHYVRFSGSNQLAAFRREAEAYLRFLTTAYNSTCIDSGAGNQQFVLNQLNTQSARRLLLEASRNQHFIREYGQLNQ